MRVTILSILAISLFSLLALANPLIVDTIHEGETVTISSQGINYQLKLVSVPDLMRRAVFSLNGEYSKALRPRERHTFRDGSILSIGNILPNEGAESGGDIVEYYFVGSGIASAPTRTLGFALGPDLEYDLSSLDGESRFTVSGLSRLNELAQQKEITEKLAALETKTESTKDECTSDDQCDDHDGCTSDVCMGSPRTCKHQKATPGCPFGTNFCVPYFRTYQLPSQNGIYCSLDGSWIEQSANGVSCSGDFECQSGLCENKQCTSLTLPTLEQPRGAPTPSLEDAPLTLWERIVAFFKGLISART